MALTYEQALAQVVAAAQDLLLPDRNSSARMAPVVESSWLDRTERLPLSSVVGRVLAESIACDQDSPPFTKSLVDGYAVQSNDVLGKSAAVELELIGEIRAGQSALPEVGAGQAVAIMTGAPLPPGADAVVMREQSQPSSTGVNRIQLQDPACKPGKNVLPRGHEMRAGQQILQIGTVLGPAAVGLLAAVGVSQPLVLKRPRLTVLTTGDEIVPVEQVPGPSQIRNANESTVFAAASLAGAEVCETLGIAGDDPEQLRERMRIGLQAEIFVLTGGVSVGQADLVPQLLTELGVTTIFHGVAIKPGKPIWFGKQDHGLVFGLPGNPVSVLVGMHCFVATALRILQGMPLAKPLQVPAQLVEPFQYPTDRETFYPARLFEQNAQLWVQPLPWFGSPDLKSAAQANALLHTPVATANDPPRPAGSICQVLPITPTVAQNPEESAVFWNSRAAIKTQS